MVHEALKSGNSTWSYTSLSIGDSRLLLSLNTLSSPVAKGQHGISKMKGSGGMGCSDVVSVNEARGVIVLPRQAMKEVTTRNLRSTGGALVASDARMKPKSTHEADCYGESQENGASGEGESYPVDRWSQEEEAKIEQG
jgi:hypothetical protein